MRGVEGAGDDSNDTGFDDRERAGRRAADMPAWFERHIERCAVGFVRGLTQSVSLCMPVARTMMVAFADDSIIAHDHRADGRIR